MNKREAQLRSGDWAGRGRTGGRPPAMEPKQVIPFSAVGDVSFKASVQRGKDHTEVPSFGQRLVLPPEKLPWAFANNQMKLMNSLQVKMSSPCLM